MNHLEWIPALLFLASLARLTRWASDRHVNRDRRRIIRKARRA